MATTKKHYLTFSQVAFSKTWEGVPTVGIVIRQEFFAIPGAQVGDTVKLRSEDRIGAPVDYHDDFGSSVLAAKAWRRLGRGRAI